jgi:hypothetical protein
MFSSTFLVAAMPRWGAPENKLIIAGLVDAENMPVVVGNGQLVFRRPLTDTLC